MKTRLLALLPAALMLAACTAETPPPPAAPAPTPAPAPPTAPPPPPAGIVAKDIPPGFGYPGDRAEFQSWADDWQIGNIQTAAWNLWAGMTSDSGQQWNGSSLPIWETWCGDAEVFSSTGCGSLARPPRGFELASQIGHAALKAGAPVPSDGQVVAFNKFNPAMASYLATAQAGPGGSYRYTSMQDLANLNAAWPAGTAVGDRKVVDAPYTPDSNGVPGSAAMETKPVIFVVKAQGLTPIPLWMGPDFSTTPANAVPDSWFNCVLVDPANTAGPDTVPVAATPEQIAQIVPGSTMACKTYLYAPLSTIYSFEMDAAEAADWNTLVGSSGDGGQKLRAAAGDYGVLVGMHVNSKTIVNWTWETFWWQPGEDTPNNFPGSKQGMTANVQGPWRNYAMCTAWNQTQGNASSDMVVCFNPFLETSSGIPAGQSSNCVSCHGTATVGSPIAGSPPALPTMNYPATYTAPIDFNSNACTESTPPGSQTCFADFTKTDFSWAIPQNAVAPPAATPSN
ncbi:hypothetical protein [Aquimonas sp.]|jgi:hypothetical protein|uniref:hypothetical protein n=1 Tax=Aquimonas sp. TaxID=1872588 RepID=UPI0037BE99E0